MNPAGRGWGPRDRVRWQDTPHVLRLRVARSFRARLAGLHAYRCWGPWPWGLLLPDCRAVHTLGLRQPIDLVFLGGDGHILEALGSVAPNRCVLRVRARAVLELPKGYCAAPGWRDQVSAAWWGWKIET